MRQTDETQYLGQHIDASIKVLPFLPGVVTRMNEVDSRRLA